MVGFKNQKGVQIHQMEVVTAKKAKRIRNAEKRREHSKAAARYRRGQESDIFNELSASLPITEVAKAGLDKASVMRLTLCNLKLKQMMGAGCWSDTMLKKYSSFNEDFHSQINATQCGVFLLVCTLNGDVTYASEGITTELGIPQYEIMGQSMFEFSHQYDHNDVRNMLDSKKRDTENSEGRKRSCLFRMKCTVTARGRNFHLGSGNYKVIHCVGRILEGEQKCENWFIAVCEPLLHPLDVAIPLNKQVFLSKHTPDMKFEYADDNVATLIGYNLEEMMGHSLFEFCHALDNEGIAQSFKSLYEKEQTQTEQYRFLTKGGGWTWVVTQATLIQNNGGKGPNSVVCMHFITSGKEETDQVLAAIQSGTPAVVARSQSRTLKIKSFKTVAAAISVLPKQQAGPNSTNAAISTSKIFASKTKDIEKGHLMHVDNSLVVSKDEPMDLTHLAPIAGDEVIALDVVPSIAFNQLMATSKGMPETISTSLSQWSSVKSDMTSKKRRAHNHTISVDTKTATAPTVVTTSRAEAESTGIDTVILSQANLPIHVGGSVEDGDGERPRKIPKLETSPQTPQIFILVPRHRNVSLCSTSENFPESKSGDATAQFELARLVQHQQNWTEQEQVQIKSLLCTAGVAYPENVTQNDDGSSETPTSAENKKTFAASLLYDQHLSLKQLASIDYDVNAPLKTNQLLHGLELLRALEVDL